MPRRRYVWSPEVGALVEVSTNYSQPAREAPLIMPDIGAFKSPVDGSVITGRAALREHNKRNNVTNAADLRARGQLRPSREKFFSVAICPTIEIVDGLL